MHVLQLGQIKTSRVLARVHQTSLFMASLFVVALALVHNNAEAANSTKRQEMTETSEAKRTTSSKKRSKGIVGAARSDESVEQLGGELDGDWSEEWEDDWSSPWEEPKSFWQSFTGFAELALGRRIQSDTYQEYSMVQEYGTTDKNVDSKTRTDSTLEDVRLQLQNTYTLESSTINFRGHVYYDGVQSKWQGQLRELNWQGAVSSQWDIKAGQQVITWGTGNYVFINDMFNKDWQSFLAGRDDEYLKAPQFAVKASGYFDNASLDLVLTPRFSSDNFINGEVFSFYNPLGFSTKKLNSAKKPHSPEYAVRYKQRWDDLELALYGYHGFEKSPESLVVSPNGNMFAPSYAKLSVLGASMTTNFMEGIASIEIGHYNRSSNGLALSQNSSQDPNQGQTPSMRTTNVPTSETSFWFTAPDESKILFGFERELVTNLSGALQVSYEYQHDFDKAMPAALQMMQENYELKRRSLVTLQLRYSTLQNKLIVDWFTFVSPSDEDGHTRLKVNYKPNDQWQYTIGTNYFWGDMPTTFFGQFEKASSAYFSVRRFF